MIEVKNLTKYYGDFRAVNDICFNIRKGEITGLLGPNGAGKTTTMRIVTGYLKATQGDVIVGGKNVLDDPLAVKRMVGYLPESAPLYQDMIVYDYLMYAARVHNISDPERIKQTAQECGLIDVMHKNISELSKGYKQRVGLAHAMVHNPEILILDEPTTGLDPNQIIEIRNLIKRIGSEKTVILSTHILPEVEATCDRVVIINQGEIVADDKTSEIHRSLKNTQTVFLIVSGCSPDEIKNSVQTLNGVRWADAKAEEGGLVTVAVECDDDKEMRPLLFRKVADSGWSLYEMTRERNSLEKVFRQLTIGGESNE